MNRWEVFEKLAVGKVNPAEDRATRLHQDAYSHFCLLFNPGKVMLVTDSSQPDRSGNCGSMNALTFSASSRRTSRSESLLD
jgi:hypothetical protein